MLKVRCYSVMSISIQHVAISGIKPELANEKVSVLSNLYRASSTVLCKFDTPPIMASDVAIDWNCQENKLLWMLRLRTARFPE